LALKVSLAGAGVPGAAAGRGARGGATRLVDPGLALRAALVLGLKNPNRQQQKTSLELLWTRGIRQFN